jgi:DASS family divalent anion:Na+ symporter
VPPLLAALPSAYVSSLIAGITHCGTGSAPIFFSAGYVRPTEWWRIGFLVSLADLGIWLGVGIGWWKLSTDCLPDPVAPVIAPWRRRRRRANR